MHKTVILTLLLLSAVWLAAQEMPPSNATKTGKAEPTTIQGCLQSAENKFTLVESDGTAHLLSGSGKKLSQEVGHEVELTGKNETRTLDATVPGGASNVKMMTIFQVKTIKKVDDTCKSY